MYFAKEQRLEAKGETWIPLANEASENAVKRSFRYRSLGCMPCTGAVPSTASNVQEIIEELKSARRSERENRVIDQSSQSAMEEKKREGYF